MKIRLMLALTLVTASLVAGGCGSPPCPAIPEGTAKDVRKDMERAKEIAEQVVEATNGSCDLADNELGYSVAIAHKKRRDIVVRVMARGGDRENYYRIAVRGKPAVTKDGEFSNDQARTHHDIADEAVDEILEIIDKVREND